MEEWTPELPTYRGYRWDPSSDPQQELRPERGWSVGRLLVDSQVGGFVVFVDREER